MIPLSSLPLCLPTLSQTWNVHFGCHSDSQCPMLQLTLPHPTKLRRKTKSQKSSDQIINNPQVLDPKERPIRTLTPEKDDKPFIQGDPTAQVTSLLLATDENVLVITRSNDLKENLNSKSCPELRCLPSSRSRVC